MKEITLYTIDGREVTRVSLPPFVLMPEGILWGERAFFRRADGKYYEGMLYPIIPHDATWLDWRPA